MKVKSIKCSHFWFYTNWETGYVSSNCDKQVYKSYIQPRLDYGITLYGSSTQKNIDLVQRVQNHAAKLIMGNFDYTSGGHAAQNAAARSHMSELTRGRFCFRVSTGGLRWVPQMSRASSGWPGAGKTKGSRGLSLSLHISGSRTSCETAFGWWVILGKYVLIKNK